MSQSRRKKSHMSRGRGQSFSTANFQHAGCCSRLACVPCHLPRHPDAVYGCWYSPWVINDLIIVWWILWHLILQHIPIIREFFELPSTDPSFLHAVQQKQAATKKRRKNRGSRISRREATSSVNRHFSDVPHSEVLPASGDCQRQEDSSVQRKTQVAEPSFTDELLPIDGYIS